MASQQIAKNARGEISDSLFLPGRVAPNRELPLFGEYTC